MNDNRVDYNKKFNRDGSETDVDDIVKYESVNESVDETIPNSEQSVEELAVAKVDLHGKATHLNIRSNPEIADNEIKTVPDGEEIMVYVNEDHDDWAKIVTASGIEGFVMKSFISFEA